MEISFKKALTAPFNDENWLLKVGIGVLLFFPTIFFAEKSAGNTIFSLIAIFFMTGYYLLVLNNEIKNIENILPDWDFIKIANIALQGLLVSLGYLLISLPVIAVFTALIMFLKPLSFIFIIIGAIILIFWYTFFIPIAQSLFAKDFELSEAFNFQKIFDITKNSWKHYLLAIFYSFLIGLIYGFCLGFAGGVIGYFHKPTGVFIMQISQVLSFIAGGNLYGQTFKKATLYIENN